MNPARRHALIAALMLGGSAWTAHAIKPRHHIADDLAKMDLEQAFPRVLGSWRQDTSLPATIVSPDVEAMLSKLYAQTLSRVYVNERGQRIMLSVAYGGDQSDATRAHRPDVCYPAQGFQIESSRDASVPLPAGPLPVRQMIARLGSRVEPVSFWFAVGSELATSGQQQKLAQLRYGLKGQIPDGMLVRVSSIDPDAEAAYALQSEFIKALRRDVPPQWAPRIFGAVLGS